MAAKNYLPPISLTVSTLTPKIKREKPPSTTLSVHISEVLLYFYQHVHVHIFQEQVLWTRPDKLDYMPAGDYSFVFCFSLPSTCPCSTPDLLPADEKGYAYNGYVYLSQQTLSGFSQTTVPDNNRLKIIIIIDFHPQWSQKCLLGLNAHGIFMIFYGIQHVQQQYFYETSK